MKSIWNAFVFVTLTFAFSSLSYANLCQDLFHGKDTPSISDFDWTGKFQSSVASFIPDDVKWFTPIDPADMQGVTNDENKEIYLGENSNLVVEKPTDPANLGLIELAWRSLNHLVELTTFQIADAHSDRVIHSYKLGLYEHVETVLSDRQTNQFLVVTRKIVASGLVDEQFPDSEAYFEYNFYFINGEQVKRFESAKINKNYWDIKGELAQVNPKVGQAKDGSFVFVTKAGNLVIQRDQKPAPAKPWWRR